MSRGHTGRDAQRRGRRGVAEDEGAGFVLPTCMRALSHACVVLVPAVQVT